VPLIVVFLEYLYNPCNWLYCENYISYSNGLLIILHVIIHSYYFSTKQLLLCQRTLTRPSSQCLSVVSCGERMSTGLLHKNQVVFLHSHTHTHTRARARAQACTHARMYVQIPLIRNLVQVTTDT
jgi:hypothetical protein